MSISIIEVYPRFESSVNAMRGAGPIVTTPPISSRVGAGQAVGRLAHGAMNAVAKFSVQEQIERSIENHREGLAEAFRNHAKGGMLLVMVIRNLTRGEMTLPVFAYCDIDFNCFAEYHDAVSVYHRNLETRASVEEYHPVSTKSYRYYWATKV